VTVVQVVSVLLEMLLELISGYVYVTRTTDMVHDGTAVLVHDVGWVVGGVVGSGEDGYVGFQDHNTTTLPGHPQHPVITTSLTAKIYVVIPIPTTH